MAFSGSTKSFNVVLFTILILATAFGGSHDLMSVKAAVRKYKRNHIKFYISFFFFS